MVLAKPLGKNPRALAEEIRAEIVKDRTLRGADVAGPGFINIRLASGYWQRLLADMVAAGTDYGRSTVGSGRKVNVEYVSAQSDRSHACRPLPGCRGRRCVANPARLCRLRGVQGIYINDAGSQIDVLARSVFLRYREALGETIGEIPEGLYPGDYLVPSARR